MAASTEPSQPILVSLETGISTKTLQVRHKWQEPYPNIQEDDIVLLKDNQVARNEWPMALVTSVFPGQDGKVRKVELKVTKEGSSKTFLRPISEVILLLRK